MAYHHHSPAERAEILGKKFREGKATMAPVPGKFQKSLTKYGEPLLDAAMFGTGMAGGLGLGTKLAQVLQRMAMKKAGRMAGEIVKPGTMEFARSMMAKSTRRVPSLPREGQKLLEHGGSKAAKALEQAAAKRAERLRFLKPGN